MPNNCPFELRCLMLLVYLTLPTNPPFFKLLASGYLFIYLFIFYLKTFLVFLFSHLL